MKTREEIFKELVEEDDKLGLNRRYFSTIYMRLANDGYLHYAQILKYKQKLKEEKDTTLFWLIISLIEAFIIIFLLIKV